ncbi:hypothetical protein AAGW05_09145 [Arthrobacter sp. LAPM80]|uniref:hypothetical protein n=1 Tax=Arthrobacter sp. LAPM80 TaxID=3141788 RepID=UPI00398AD466
MAVYVAVVGILAIHWQNDVHSKVDMPAVDGLDLVTCPLVAAVTGGIFSVPAGDCGGWHPWAAA